MSNKSIWKASVESGGSTKLYGVVSLKAYESFVSLSCGPASSPQEPGCLARLGLQGEQYDKHMYGYVLVILLKSAAIDIE